MVCYFIIVPLGILLHVHFLYVLQDSEYKSNPHIYKPTRIAFTWPTWKGGIFLSYIHGSSLKKSKKNFTGLWLQLSDSNGHPIHLTNQDSMHMSHMKRDRFLSYWLCDTWTLKIKKEHDMHNQTSGIHQKWGFNSQQSKAKVKGRCYHLPQNWSMIFVSYS